MSTVKELFNDAVKYEESLLAHYIFFLLQEGKIELSNHKDTLKFDLAQSEKFQKMYKSNVLGFDQIKIYSLKQRENYFIFIFSKNPKEARELYWRTYAHEPINCMELSPDEIMWYGNRAMTFRDIKKEMKEFPCILGYYEKPYSGGGN